jgi:hypothetical protein
MSDHGTIIKAARQAAIMAVGEVLQKTGVEPELITYSEIKKLYGRKLADDARCSELIEWYPGPKKGSGNMAFCKRSEFREFLFSTEREIRIEKSFSIIN